MRKSSPVPMLTPTTISRVRSRRYTPAKRPGITLPIRSCAFMTTLGASRLSLKQIRRSACVSSKYAEKRFAPVVKPTREG